MERQASLKYKNVEGTALIRLRFLNAATSLWATSGCQGFIWSRSKPIEKGSTVSASTIATESASSGGTAMPTTSRSWTTIRGNEAWLEQEETAAGSIWRSPARDHERNWAVRECACPRPSGPRKPDHCHPERTARHNGGHALLIGPLFGTSAQMWMNLQSTYELESAEDTLSDQTPAGSHAATRRLTDASHHMGSCLPRSGRYHSAAARHMWPRRYRSSSGTAVITPSRESSIVAVEASFRQSPDFPISPGRYGSQTSSATSNVESEKVGEQACR